MKKIVDHEDALGAARGYFEELEQERDSLKSELVTASETIAELEKDIETLQEQIEQLQG
jgi:predicted  nucleic acid-binding Zn-ribbon protein